MKKKGKKMWVKSEQRTTMINFHRLNLIEEYNYNMNSVDVVDQLRGSYRFDKWMRKRKWWWSMFFWMFQMLLTNSYILYCKYMKLHDLTPISHYDYHKAVSLAWINKETNWPTEEQEKKGARRTIFEKDGVSVDTPSDNTRAFSASSIASRQSELDASRRSRSVSDKSLDPEQGVLRC